MRILLIGEYSNVHWTLGEGLRALGHEVTVVSDGDRWKGYQRDVDLRRRGLGPLDSLRYWLRVQRLLPRLRGYDVVQLINPVFLDLRAERIASIYDRLRRLNGRMVLGAFGIDKQWVEEGLKPDTFRYSDFRLNGQLRTSPEVDSMVADWLHVAKGALNDYIAADCDAIVSGLYEYHHCHQRRYADKTTFIPFPINHGVITPRTPSREDGTIRAFIGIQRERNAYKGTDIMLRALERLAARYPQLRIVKAESVPFAQYETMMNGSDLILDQLYSYTPAMNALVAMAKGLVVVGGAEEEHYALMGEGELRPVVNVQPSEASVEEEIERRILADPSALARLSEQSMLYTRRWHDHVRVATRYAELYKGL